MLYLIEGGTSSVFVFLQSARDLPWVYLLIEHYGADIENVDVSRTSEKRVRMYIPFHNCTLNVENPQRAMLLGIKGVADLLRILLSEGIELDSYVFTAPAEEESQYDWHSIDLATEDSEPVRLTPEQIVTAVLEQHRKA